MTGRQILERLNENIGVRNDHDVENSIGSDRRSIVSRVEQFFSHATQADSKFLYIYNCESPPQGAVSCLSGISGHLDPRKNSRIEEMPGINTSMFYIGCAGSFTELHVEDSIADSANVIHMGKEKIWMIIDRQEYARINEIVAQKWKDFSDANGDNARLSAERCVLPLHHKNLVLTPRFLDEHKIRYEFVLQNAGDLLYIRYGVLHQVINVGLNVAEAINVGSDAWNFGNELKMLCPCDDCQLDHVATNTDVDMSVNVGKPKSRAYECETCLRIFSTKQLLARHKKDDHGAKHVCGICDRQFEHVQSLSRHVRVIHDTSEQNNARSNVCPVCSKQVKDLVRHQRERHRQLVECSECQAKFTRHDLAQHEKTCMRFTCTNCSKVYKTRRALAGHLARWCDSGKKRTT